MSGKEIKAIIRANGLYCWEVAAALGMQDSNFSRRLRTPFDDNDVAKVRRAIELVKAKKAVEKE